MRSPIEPERGCISRPAAARPNGRGAFAFLAEMRRRRTEMEKGRTEMEKGRTEMEKGRTEMEKGSTEIKKG
jgi:hypothetical protein